MLINNCHSFYLKSIVRLLFGLFSFIDIFVDVRFNKIDEVGNNPLPASLGELLALRGAFLFFSFALLCNKKMAFPPSRNLVLT